jgi:hypothetical protein
MFIGHINGGIIFYQNMGTSINPVYKEITAQFANIDISWPSTEYYGRTSPVFCDIDADGDSDLFSGDGEGLVHFWRNIGNAQNDSFQ